MGEMNLSLSIVRYVVLDLPLSAISRQVGAFTLCRAQVGLREQWTIGFLHPRNCSSSPVTAKIPEKAHENHQEIRRQPMGHNDS